MKENILIKFANGRQCWVSKFDATIAQSLVNRFQSKIVSAPNISAPARQAASSKRVYKTGQAWQQEHNRHNKAEDYEVPRSKRKKPVHNKLGTGGSINGGEIGVYKLREEIINNGEAIEIDGIWYGEPTDRFKGRWVSDDNFQIWHNGRWLDGDDVHSELEMI